MNSKDIVYNFQLQIFEIFKSQDPDLFDTVFEIDGKKLYAHKYLLIAVSPTFMAMLSDRWNSNENDAIKIKDYKFEDFKELLNFIYSGKCNITDSNIFTMLDMAEFYQIKHLKNICGKKMKFHLGNIYQLIEISSRYSITQMKHPIQSYISYNFSAFLKCEKFWNAKKSFVTDLMDYIGKPEEAFSAVYVWSEAQAYKKLNESKNDENFNVNDAMKNEISDFLPLIKFNRMKKKFLREFVVKKEFLFSSKKFNEISKYANSAYKVVVTNSYGLKMFGFLSPNSKAAEIIDSLEERLSFYENYDIVYWDAYCNVPSTPSQFKKRKGCEWYLVCAQSARIGIARRQGITPRHYILAEMNSVRNFDATQCHIKIV